MKPTLLTFDVFGTVVDWKCGLRADLARQGVALSDEQFEQVLTAQEIDESAGFQTYRIVTARSLVKVLGLDLAAADAIGQNVGHWPLFPDAKEALRLLLAVMPCVAMTNSDRAHGEQVQAQLGFPWTDWVCAEEVGVYKPAVEFWHAITTRYGLLPGRHWWHVSAYADYDLAPCGRLGLTTVFVARPHSRSGLADHKIDDLRQLLPLVEGT